MTQRFGQIFRCAILFCTSFLLFAGNAFAQAAAEKPQQKAAPSPEEKTAEPPNAAQIDLLETKYRFETNGDSRKEVHALVKINSELGVRQFARLNFDYNRSFQSVEIPLMHITHTSGGTADILPSAITDVPNPAVEKFPAYQDVRIKSVRILGLQPGDSLEYRVITAATHAPLAPDFWMEHEFSQEGVVTKELFAVDLPFLPKVRFFFPESLPPAVREQTGEGDSARQRYEWNVSAPLRIERKSTHPETAVKVAVTTFETWQSLANRLNEKLIPREDAVRSLYPKAKDLTQGTAKASEWIHAFYDFVSKKIKTVDLPLGSTGFQTRTPEEILASGYGTPEDKFVLFAAIGNNFCGPARAGFVDSSQSLPEKELPMPSLFDHLLTMSGYPSVSFWMDLNLEVAPYRMIPAQFRRKQALLIGPAAQQLWQPILDSLPFPATQNVTIAARLDPEGMLKTKVKYLLRGDNELLLRVTFHRTPKEKQQEIAQYLALSDGFRGKVTSVKTSDPYATDAPFEVEYELTQEKFVDWSKKPVRIPALLPLPGLPEPPKKSDADAKIELGPPLNVELSGTLRLPPGTTAQAPPGTSVRRDYATFSSVYSTKENLIRFSRHLKFVSQEISGARAVDLSAFLHAVQSDQSQLFVLEKPESASPAKPK